MENKNDTLYELKDEYNQLVQVWDEIFVMKKGFVLIVFNILSKKNSIYSISNINITNDVDCFAKWRSVLSEFHEFSKYIINIYKFRKNEFNDLCNHFKAIAELAYNDLYISDIKQNMQKWDNMFNKYRTYALDILTEFRKYDIIEKKSLTIDECEKEWKKIYIEYPDFANRIIYDIYDSDNAENIIYSITSLFKSIREIAGIKDGSATEKEKD